MYSLFVTIEELDLVETFYFLAETIQQFKKLWNVSKHFVLAVQVPQKYLSLSINEGGQIDGTQENLQLVKFPLYYYKCNL